MQQKPVFGLCGHEEGHPLCHCLPPGLAVTSPHVAVIGCPKLGWGTAGDFSLNKYQTDVPWLSNAFWFWYPVWNIAREFSVEVELTSKSKTWELTQLYFLFYKPKSIVVCFRAASSTNFASTLSCPVKASRPGKREKEKRVTMKLCGIYNAVPTALWIIIILYFSKIHCSENGLLKLTKPQNQERPCASTKWVFNILNPFKNSEVP